jgi:molybdopterin synthase sulfur carrier subunit
MSKRITVRYFAGFREHAGVDEETLDVDARTARDVFTRLSHRHGSDEPLGHCKVAINDEMADWETPISDGDTVFLFPPVAGG